MLVLSGVGMLLTGFGGVKLFVAPLLCCDDTSSVTIPLSTEDISCTSSAPVGKVWRILLRFLMYSTFPKVLAESASR